MHQVGPGAAQDRCNVVFRGFIVASLTIVLLASAAAKARADECPVRVLALNLEGIGTSDQIQRYRVILEAASGDAPRDVDLQILVDKGHVPLYARAPRLQFYRDEDSFDDVVVFDRPTQDVSGIAVADTLSNSVASQ